MSELREEAAIAREALVTHRFHASASSCIGFTHLKAPPPEHLIHLHELLDANGVASRFTTLA